ncbi:Guanine nucleotide exchange factor VAV3 [Larimichthys crocea]|uniref:Uncharacterized protein n=1 Tax=Larimichthys crocea TaxID=215358 RepID=A0ACD3QSS2_LARCR|nr:Guanine nucleotide exchange factor VAV3 [Larimichthys crocea]
MERYQAEVELLDRGNSTYLVRHRSKECTEYAISIKFNDRVKHIKILTKDGCFYIAESRLFKTVLELVEYYKQYSLKEGFSSLDTTLQVPYRENSNGNMPRAITKAGSGGNATSSEQIVKSKVINESDSEYWWFICYNSPVQIKLVKLLCVTEKKQQMHRVPSPQRTVEERLSLHRRIMQTQHLLGY